MTWSTLPGPELHFFGYAALAVTEGGRNIVLSVRYWDPSLGGSGSGLFLSDDHGTSWTRVDLPPDYIVYKIFPLDELHGVAVATEFGPADDSGWRPALRDRVLVTHDGWLTFESVFDDCPRERFSNDPFMGGYQGCSVAVMASADRLVVGRNDGWTFLSTDGGNSWIPSQRLIAPVAEEPEERGWTTTTLSMVSGLDFVDESRGFALSASGAVWRTMDGGESWLRETSLQTGPSNAGDALVALPDGRAIAGDRHFVHVRGPGWSAGGTHNGTVPGPIRRAEGRR